MSVLLSSGSSPSVFVGADVSKSRLDVHHAGQTQAIRNDARGIGGLVGRLRRLQPRLIVVEATGGYERPLVYGLSKAGLPVVRVNPLHVRRFAQSRGILSK